MGGGGDMTALAVAEMSGRQDLIPDLEKAADPDDQIPRCKCGSKAVRWGKDKCLYCYRCGAKRT